MVDISRYFALFTQTSQKHMDVVLKNIDDVQHKYADEAFMKSIHLAAHSLKGEASIMEFRSFGAYCTVIEKYLKKILMTKENISDGMFLELKHACSHLSESYQKVLVTKADIPSMLDEAKRLEVTLGIPGSI